MGMWEDMQDFHEKFELPQTPVPSFADAEIMAFRIKFMREELNEFCVAYRQDNLTEAFDALLDLVYVVMGTAWMCNFPWNRGWEAVQQANMHKIRAKNTSESKRKSRFDVVKPVGWNPPNEILTLLLKNHTYACEQRAMRKKKDGEI